ncbi:MAG: hypothetical protein KDK89_21490 [Alphaproteobacteria bacterium]|nr:hypothetical protein [Alphaproteobacteria bacterium]
MKKSGKAGKGSNKRDNAAFRIKLRGQDGAPLSMAELRDGLYEATRRLRSFEGTYRAKWVTLYLTMVDEDGNEVLPDRKGEWTLYPYKSAADEHGV